MIDYEDRKITYRPDHHNDFRWISNPKIVGYANAILDRGCDWDKDYGRCNQLNKTYRGIIGILKKAVVKIDMQFKKQRNHILCGFGRKKKNFVFVEVKSLRESRWSPVTCRSLSPIGFIVSMILNSTFLV